MLSIQKQLINYNFSKRNCGIKYIVVHDVGAVSTAQNNRDYFAGGNRNASADFFVDSNNIIQIIDYHNNYSWAVGDGRGRNGITNGNSVSIEMCLESNLQPSERTIQNTLDLVKHLMKELNISSNNVIRHYDASGKSCPHSFSLNNWVKWYDFKRKLGGNVSISNTQYSNRTYLQKGDRSEEVKQIQTMLIKLGCDCGGYGADGIYGQGCVDSIKAFQSKHGLSVDGLCGVSTKSKIKEEYNKVINQSKQNVNKKKEEDNMFDKIVLYYGDLDALSGFMLSQKYQCAMMKESDFKAKGCKAKETIIIGGANGTISGKDRFETFKKVGQHI